MRGNTSGPSSDDPTPVESNGEVKPTGRLVVHKLPQDSDRSDLEVNTSDAVSLSDKIILQGKGETTEGIRVADSQGEGSGADLFEDGTIVRTNQGKSRQGEAGTIEVCQTLVNRLNRDGARWKPPTMLSKDQWVDCETGDDGGNSLKVQVTRAERRRKIWQMLNRTGTAERNHTFNEAAADLKLAIEEKAKHIPVVGRGELILALNAQQTPDYVFKAVVDSFRTRNGDWARWVGFKAIWVVGPTEELTFRLDHPG